MAQGILSNLFADFFLETGPTTATGPEKIINEIQRRTYLTSFVMGGMFDMQDMFQGGEKIHDLILLDSDSTYEHISPDDELTYRSSENLTEWEAHWRFTVAHMTFNEKAKGMNGLAGLRTDAMFDQFKVYMRPIEQNFWTSICNGLEHDWFVAPNNATMEVSTGRQPSSLPCFVNEYQQSGIAATGAKASGITADGLPAGFSTIQNISPTLKPKWDNVRTFYTDTAPAAGSDILDAMGATFRRCHYKKMPKRADMGEGETFPGLIITSEQGDMTYEKILQLSNDPLSAASVSKGDAYIDGLHYRGIPIDYLDEMTHGAFYADGTGGTASYVGEFTDSVDFDGNAIAAPSVHTGPRYAFLDNRYLRTFFKSGDMFETAKVTPERKPWTRVVVTSLEHNNYVRSRQRLGWVGPAALFTRLA